MNKIYIILLGFALVLGVLGLVFPSGQSDSLGGTTRANTTIDNDFAVNRLATLSALSVSGSSTLAFGGTATWDPAELASGSSTFTEVAVTGWTSGMPCIAGHTAFAPTSSNAVTLSCFFATSTARATLHNATTTLGDGGAYNLPSGTLTVGQILF